MSMPPFSQLGKAGVQGTVDSGFSSLGVLHIMAGGAILRDLGLGEQGCLQDMSFCVRPRVWLS